MQNKVRYKARDFLNLVHFTGLRQLNSAVNQYLTQARRDDFVHFKKRPPPPKNLYMDKQIEIKNRILKNNKKILKIVEYIKCSND